MTQLILQPGPAAGIDAYLYGDWKNNNFGTSTTLKIAAGYEYHSTAAYRSLLQFDVSELAGSTVESAMLTLYYASTYQEDTNSYTISCYRCPTAWTELGATWNKYDGANAWPVNGAGGDWDASIVAVCTEINGAVDLAIDIKSHVEDAITNRGGVLNLLCKITGVDSNYPQWNHSYYSSDEITEAAKRPKVVIDYIAPAGGMPSAVRSTLRPTLRPTIQSSMR